MAQVCNGLRRAFCRQNVIPTGGRLPNVRHREKLGRQGVSSFQRPVSVQVFGMRETSIAEVVERFLHRVERVTLTRHDAELDDLVVGLWQRLRGVLLHLKSRSVHDHLAD